MYPGLGSQLELPFLPLAGGTLTGNLTLPAAGTLQFASSTKLRASSDGVLRLTSSADAAGSLLLGAADATGCLLIHSGTNGVMQLRTGNSGANGSLMLSVVYAIGESYIYGSVGSTLYANAAVTATPEGSVTGSVGSTITDKTNGRLYYKQTGTGNTGYTEFAECLLATVTGIDTSSVAKQTLYTVPTGKVAYITKVVARDPSAAITLCQGSFGFNANADDVIAASSFTSMSGATIYRVVTPIATGAVEGAAAAVFGFKTTAQEGAADTLTMDVYGYLR